MTSMENRLKGIDEAQHMILQEIQQECSKVEAEITDYLKNFLITVDEKMISLVSCLIINQYLVYTYLYYVIEC